MKNERQVKLQMASWIIKDRWKPLLDWFNQNDTKQEQWALLLGQARMYDFQTKWPHYLDFFQKHLDHKTHKGMPLVMHSGARDNAWKLLDVAMPVFFAQAAALLTPTQRKEFCTKAMEWFAPWLPQAGEPQSIHMRDSLNTVFRTLVNFDGKAEWKTVEHLVRKEYVGRLVQYTLDKDIEWANALRQLHLSHGYSQASWGLALLKGDCVEHLLAETTPLPVSKALLDCAVEEQRSRSNKSEEAIAMIFRRYPHLRVWTEKSPSDDAQTCRAIVGLPDGAAPCVAAQAVRMGHSLGLPLSEFSTLLEPAAVPLGMDVDVNVFDDTSLLGRVQG